MISDELQKIFDEDNSGLLDLPDKVAAQTPDERLVNSFLEIVEFYDGQGHAPSSATTNLLERRLYSRLEGMRSEPKKIQILQDFDKYNLLVPSQQSGSINDILSGDDLGLLEDDNTGILTIKNVPDRTNFPDYIGRQKPCKDFDQYEHRFTDCHAELMSGQRQLGRLKSESYIQQGRFYIVRGVLAYVASIGEVKETDKKQRNKGYLNARLRLIYENGTESDILLRSLARALYEDGRIVTETDEEIADELAGISKEDQATGYIYVLQSLSEDPVIRGMKNLYKIGFSSKDVHERVKNAANDPTYFMAPVKIVGTYKCYNLNPQKFEKLLHRFFAVSRLETEIINKQGFKNAASEWFDVPFEVIDQVVQLIINGEITHYTYDDFSQSIKVNN